MVTQSEIEYIDWDNIYTFSFYLRLRIFFFYKSSISSKLNLESVFIVKTKCSA